MVFGIIDDLKDVMNFKNSKSIHSMVVALQTSKVYCLKPRLQANYKTWRFYQALCDNAHSHIGLHMYVIVTTTCHCNANIKGCISAATTLVSTDFMAVQNSSHLSNCLCLTLFTLGMSATV